MGTLHLCDLGSLMIELARLDSALLKLNVMSYGCMVHALVLAAWCMLNVRFFMLERVI